MANYLATNAELQNTANAIRAKGGIGGNLQWKTTTGFADHINKIQTGENYNNYNLFASTYSIIGATFFRSNTNIIAAKLKDVTTIGALAFDDCTNLQLASFPNCTNIYSSAFMRCTNLTSVYLNTTGVTTLSGSNAFSSVNAGISFFVPASLLTNYKTATNWTYFSNKFVGI